MESTITSTSSYDGISESTQTATIKLIRNKTHIGPISHGKGIKADLSKATQKIMFNNNLKVTVKTEDDSEKVNVTSSNKPVVLEIEPLPGLTIVDSASYIYSAWDQICKGVGTNSYISRYQQFHQKQLKVYSELGINLNPNSPKPELTEQQRQIYDQRMSKFAFSYYEYRLSFKQPNCKAVRSLTFRTLKPKDLELLENQLIGRAKVIKEKITFTVKSR